MTSSGGNQKTGPYSRHEPESMRDTFPIEWARARGCHVWDAAGNKYIDFTSGIFVANVGHSNPIVARYLKRQIDAELWFSFTFPTGVRKAFMDELISMCPRHLNSCCLYSDGSIANEAAIKIAKQHTGKKRVASYVGSYHGNTHMLKGLEPRIPFPTGGEDFLGQIARIDMSDVAAIIMEGYQGWAAYFYEPGYVRAAKAWCRRNGALLIMDEIQSGFGRTGKMFCFQHYGVRPDVVTFGKGASSSLPLSGVLGRREVMDAMNGVELISNTHSGNCLVAAAGLGALKALQGIDMDEVSEKGEYLMGLLEDLRLKRPEVIGGLFGKGLLAAAHFRDKALCDDVTLKCIQNGLMLVRTRKGTIKMGPPLMIPRREIKRAVGIIEESIGQCLR